jgi:hypothetical protein
MNGQLVRNTLYQHIVGKLNRLRALLLDIVFFAGSRIATKMWGHWRGSPLT